jgi:iron(III) transport system ATP-binding protein
MRKGRIEQWDTAYNLYHRPASRFVADFVGEGAFIDGLASAADGIDTVLGPLRHCPGCDLKPGMPVALLLRPDDVQHDDAAPLQAEVVNKAFRGAEFLYTLRLDDGKQLLSLVPSHHDHAVGERIGIKLDVDHVVAFPRAGGADD